MNVAFPHSLYIISLKPLVVNFQCLIFVGKLACFMSIWKKILIGLLIAVGLYYSWGLYLIVFRGYDSYWAGTIYSSEDQWKQKQIGLSLVDEMHRLKHEEHWSDEEVLKWGDEMAQKHQKEINRFVVFPWIYYPAKWESERFIEKYGKDYKLWPEEAWEELHEKRH